MDGKLGVLVPIIEMVMWRDKIARVVDLDKANSKYFKVSLGKKSAELDFF